MTADERSDAEAIDSLGEASGRKKPSAPRHGRRAYTASPGRWFGGWSQPPWRRRRRTVRLPVVLSAHGTGTICWLVVRRTSVRGGGPARLEGPSMRWSGDETLRRSFEDAFAWALSQPRMRHGSVTQWWLRQDAGGQGDVKPQGRSASGAMALALAYLHGLTDEGRRPYDRATVISASVSPDGSLESVTEFRDKVPGLARDGFRLLIAPPDLPQAQAEQVRGLPVIEDVPDVSAALARMRVRQATRPLWMLPCALLVTAAVAAGTAMYKAEREDTARRVTELASFAERNADEDPGAAAAAALAAYRTDPVHPRSLPALIRQGGLDPRLRAAPPGASIAPVQVAAISPARDRIAVGERDHSIGIQDGPGQPFRRASLRGGATSALAFTPDERALISGSEDGTVARWDLSGAKPIPVKLRTSGLPVVHLTVSPDGGSLAVLESRNRVTVHDLRQPSRPPVAMPVRNPTDAAFVDNGSLAVSSNDTGIEQPSLAVYDARSARRLRELASETVVPALAAGTLSGGRRVLAAGTRGGQIVVWETKTWRIVRRLRVERPVIRLAQAEGADLLLAGTGSDDRLQQTPLTLEILEMGTGRWTGSPLGAPSMTFRGRPQLGGRTATVVALTAARRLTVWAPEPEPGPHQGGIVSVEADPLAPTQVISADLFGQIRITEAASRRTVKAFGGRAYAPLMSLGVAPDGTVLTGHTKGRIVVWDRTTGRPVRELTAVPANTRPSPILRFAFDATGQRMATGSLEGNVRLWRLADGAPLRDLRPGPRGQPAGKGSATVLLFEQDPAKRLDRLTIGYAFDAVARVPLDGGAPTIIPYPMGIQVLRKLSGDFMLVGLPDGTLQVVNARLRPIGRQPATKHGTSVMSAAVSPDGRWWLTAGQDGTARVTESATGREVVRLVTPETARQRGVDRFPQILNAAVFTGDGRFAVIATARTRMMVLDLARSSLIGRACSLLAPDPPRGTAGLTDDELAEVRTACR